jgi:CRP/FNR family transcriptional regulator, anaerobic regulatory protein
MTGHDEVLEAFPFFATLPVQARNLVLGRAVSKTLAHKQVLARDGGECPFLPFVIKGTLRIFKGSEAGREITLYRIERGESCILSATCILNGGSFPATAEAEGETEILLVPAKLLTEHVDSNPEWRRFLFGLYARRLEEVLSLVDEVAFHHMDARLAAYLLKTASSPPGSHGPGSGATASVGRTHVQIADELGTSREVVTRILRDFEAGGMITTSRGSIQVLQPAPLRERAASFFPV